jgi:hypothetical protein
VVPREGRSKRGAAGEDSGIEGRASRLADSQDMQVLGLSEKATEVGTPEADLARKRHSQRA